jgi:Holliday junction resolvase RusA-like endonuclease
MKNRIEFDVIGKPFGQKRPRAFRRGKFLGIYAPKENVEYATKVVNAFLKASGGLKLKKNGKEVITEYRYQDVPMVIEIQAFFHKPKLTKKEQALNLPKHMFPTKKPDGDNIAKAILDSLNAVAYHDDSYVVELVASKYYTDGEERVNVVIYEKQ